MPPALGWRWSHEREMSQRREQVGNALRTRLQTTPLWPMARRLKRAAQGRRRYSREMAVLVRSAWLVPTARLPAYLQGRRDARDPEAAARRCFDAPFYLRRYPDVAASGVDPFLHYMTIGAREGRSPDPIFHVAGYCYDHPGVAEFGGNPLLHYIVRGRRHAAMPHPLFDAAWYAERYADVRTSRMDPYEHFLKVGRHQGRAGAPAVEAGTDLEGTRIALPQSAREAITIIVPAYKNFALTFRTLYALGTRTPATLGFRVILADDCPENPLRPLLADVEGLEIVQNPVNLGFVRNCNQASRLANGEFIVFLNNDTVVEDGWLEALVSLARSDPAIGIVGCKLLNADDSLQEAGIVMFSDALGNPYGAGDRADRPEYNFVRQVDGVSGACLLVRRDAFEHVGRFDEAYAPAFFEEYALAFSMMAAGYKVMYQPASRVRHYGSASYGIETRDRQTAINRTRFVADWHAALATRYGGPEDLFLARDRRPTRGTILVIDDKVPQHDRSAGGLTMSQYLRLLSAERFKVIFMPADGRATEPYTSMLQQLGIEVLYGDVNLNRWLKKNGRFVDWVLLARPIVARAYLDLVRRKTRARLLYYTHDVHFFRERRRYETLGDPGALRDSEYLRTIETTIFRRVDCVLTPSADEVPVIQELAPRQEVRVLPPYFFPVGDGSLVDSQPPLRNRDAIIFVGGYDHLPNVDGAEVLVTEVMPYVWQRVPRARVLLVGSDPPPSVRALAGDRVEVLGHVSDLSSAYARARMSVSPLRFGSGVKGKIVSSLEAGVPVVTTTIGNEGIALEPGIEALIADQPEAIAANVVRLFEDPDFLKSLAAAGHRAVFERFSEDRARQALFDALRLKSCNV